MTAPLTTQQILGRVDQTGMKRSNSPAGWNANKTHCVNGHPFDEKNTVLIKNGRRYCKECKRIYTQKYLQRKNKIKKRGGLRI